MATTDHTVSFWPSGSWPTLISEYHLYQLLSTRSSLQCPIKKLQLSKSIFSEYGERIRWADSMLEVDDSSPLPESSQSPGRYLVRWPFDEDNVRD